MKSPPRWTVDQLTAGAEAARHIFRHERLDEPLERWKATFALYEAQFHQLFDEYGIADPAKLSAAQVAAIFRDQLGDAGPDQRNGRKTAGIGDGGHLADRATEWLDKPELRRRKRPGLESVKPAEILGDWALRDSSWFATSQTASKDIVSGMARRPTMHGREPAMHGMAVIMHGMASL